MKLSRIQIPPCRPYEINAAETWLSDMSEAGLHPEHDFIFAGLAFFERGGGFFFRSTARQGGEKIFRRKIKKNIDRAGGDEV